MGGRGRHAGVGQLGCNGFIVIDGSHSVVCKATRAYLEVKETAFRHVETLLSALIVEKPVPKQESGRVDGSVGGACATVRFGADGNAKAEPAKAESEGTAPRKVASVKVKVLDEEHERCEAALAQLKKLRNVTALRELLAAYETHLNPHRSPNPKLQPQPHPREDRRWSACISAMSPHTSLHLRAGRLLVARG